MKRLCLVFMLCLLLGVSLVAAVLNGTPSYAEGSGPDNFLPLVVKAPAATATPSPTVTATPEATATVLPGVDHPYPGSCLTPDEQELARLVNEYRAQNGLAAAPVSKSLSQVAQWHVIDLREHNPASGTDPRGQSCNLHSWSDQGVWSPVCYTGDHEYAQGMWDKPAEITGGIYTGYGFEIAARGGSTPSDALNGWKGSPAHNAVILEQGPWADYDWPAMGVGRYGEYSVVWFGEQTDPQGTLGQCP